MIKQLNTLVILCFFSLNALAYIVKPGDTLGKIAQRFYAGKVHGKGGSIEKIVAENPQIKNNTITPGMELTLNPKYMLPGAVDPDDEDVANNVRGADDEESDSDAGLNPFIEVEKYDDKKGKLFKDSTSDKINFFVDFGLNNFQGTHQVTLQKFNFTTSTETNLGFEYVKNLSEMTNLTFMIGVNHYATSAVSTLSPPLNSSEKSQAIGALGIRLRITDDNYLSFNGNYRPHYYLLVDAVTGNLDLDHRPSIAYNIDSENFFYHNKDYEVGVELGLDYIPNPQKNTGKGVDTALGYNVGFVFQQSYKSNDKVKVTLNYRYVDLNSAVYKLEDRVIALGFLYSLPY